MMRSRLLPVLAIAALTAALVAVTSTDARGGDPLPKGPVHPDEVHDCKAGENPCAWFLKPAMPPAWDQFWTCGGCRAERRLTDPECDEGKGNPEWDPGCWDRNLPGCYLRRHAREWNFTCSEMTRQCCPEEDWKTCPEHEPGGGWSDSDLEWVLARKRKDAGVTGYDADEIIVCRSQHFELVWAITREVKVMTAGLRRARKFTPHEMAHLYIQRMEDAYADFVRVFGPQIRLNNQGRIQVLLSDKGSAKSNWARLYIGNENSNLLYGGTGIFASDPNLASDDLGLHLFVRHEIGHLLIAAYRGYDSDRNLPTWLYVGAAHWLSKMQLPLQDEVTFCANEGTAVNGSGKEWHDRVGKIVAKNDHLPLAELFLIDVQGKMPYEGHVQSWSLFEWLTREVPDEFVQVISDIKRKSPTREAFREHLGVTPEKLEEVWLAVVANGFTERTGAWDDDVPASAAEADEADRRFIEKLLKEENPAVAASMVDGLQKIKSVAVARAVVRLLGGKSDLVRETAVRILVQSDEPAVVEYLRGEAMTDSPPLSRAHVVRVLALKGDPDVLPQITAALDEGYWLTRANAAWALGRFGDSASLDRLATLTEDSEPKVRIAAMDALGAFGPTAAGTIDRIVPMLKDGAWQVRLTAVQAMHDFRDAAAIGPIIDRMKVEDGRVEDEMVELLKDFTGRNFGNDHQKWWEWWQKRKDGFAPRSPRDDDDKDDEPEGGDTYVDKPEYYGIKVYSRGVVFVLDRSGSMTHRLVKNQGVFKYGEKSYKSSSKMGVAQEELVDVLEGLDKRTLFNLIFFSDRVQTWKNEPVLANDRNKSSAISRVENVSAGGETNYHDTFKEVFGVTDEDPYSNNLLNRYDTVFFLTDGRPTAGEVTRTDALLAWFKDQNRFAKMKVHVIALGYSDIDIRFLQGLAEAGDGKFVHIRGDE